MVHELLIQTLLGYTFQKAKSRILLNQTFGSGPQNYVQTNFLNDSYAITLNDQ